MSIFGFKMHIKSMKKINLGKKYKLILRAITFLTLDISMFA